MRMLRSMGSPDDRNFTAKEIKTDGLSSSVSE